MKTPLCLLALTTAVVAQTTASFVPYGAGCNGSNVAACLTLNDVNPTLQVASLPNEYAYPVVNTSGNAIQIVGFEIYTQTNSGLIETGKTGLLFDNSGPAATVHTSPAASNVANGTITVTGTAGWYSTSIYPPVTIPAGGAFWFHVDAYSKIAPPQHTVAGGVAGPVNNFYRRPSNNMVWTSSVSVARQIFRIHCLPASPAVPTLLAAQPPRLGQQFRLDLSGGQPNLVGFAIWSFDNTQWANFPTPVDLGLFGAPTCFNYTSADSVVTVVLDAAGAANTPYLTVPTATAFSGLTWYNQAAMIAPGVNSLSMLFSNAATAVVGN